MKVRNRDLRPVGDWLALAARQEGEAFKQLHILFVFQQRTVQFRQVGFGITPQVFGRQILGKQEF